MLNYVCTLRLAGSFVWAQNQIYKSDSL